MPNEIQITIPNHSIVPIELHHSTPFIKAELNGKEVLFLFDSGAPDIILNREYIASEKLHSENTMVGSSGPFTGNKTELGTLKIGGFSFAGQSVSAIEMKHMEEGFEVQIHGLFGFRQIVHCDWMLDYEKEEMQVWKDADPSDFDILEKFKTPYRNHLPSLKVNIGGQDFLMLVDTGASVILFDQNKQNAIMDHVSGLKEQEASGAGATKVTVQEGLLDGFRVGDTQFDGWEINFSNIEVLKTRLGEFDGIIGAAIFKQQKTMVSWIKRELWFLK